MTGIGIPFDKHDMQMSYAMSLVLHYLYQLQLMLGELFDMLAAR